MGMKDAPMDRFKAFAILLGKGSLILELCGKTEFKAASRNLPELELEDPPQR